MFWCTIDLGKEYYIWLKKERKDRQKICLSFTPTFAERTIKT